MGIMENITAEVIQKIYPLNQLSGEALRQLLPAMRTRWYKQGNDLFRVGDSPDDHYYVLEGSVWLADQKEEKFQSVGPDDFIPLPYIIPSVHRARTTADSKLLLVDRLALAEVLKKYQPDSAQAMELSYQAQRPRESAPRAVDQAVETAPGGWQGMFLRAPGFQRVAKNDLRRAFELMRKVSYKAGDTVIEQGTPADNFYVVAEGRVEVLRAFNGHGETRVAEYGPGATIGEDALISGNLRNATVRMVTDGRLMRLDGDDFRFLIKRALVRGVEGNEAREMVARGSRWLDVRMPDERKACDITNAITIPHPVVRGRLFTADPQLSYVCVCAKGYDAPVIAFTLCKYGFDAYYLKGGYASYAAAVRRDEWERKAT
jgi:CRP-like cAMP-binding protein